MIKDGQETITDALENVVADDDGSAETLSDRPQTTAKGVLDDGETVASCPTSAGRSSQAAEGSMPLLGLELTDTENTAENSAKIEDSNQQTLGSPLLGTSISESTETLGKSSQRRSPKRVCYGKLLRESGPTSGGKSRKTISSSPRGCYGICIKMRRYHQGPQTCADAAS